MAVNKNFVVKNGLEVKSNLIYADTSLDSVGIGTTTVGHKLHVIGGIGATTTVISGISTVGSLSIGSNEVISDARELKNISSLDSNTTTTISSAVLGGALNAPSLDITGISTLQGAVIASSSLDVAGITTIGSLLDANGGLEVAGGAGLDVVGHSEFDNVNISGISTISSLDVSSLTVSGLSTFSGIGTFSSDLYVAGDLNVVGDLIYDEATAVNLNVTGVGTIATIHGAGTGLTGVSTTFTSAIGIQSAGLAIGVGVTQLNFIGAGNTFLFNEGTDTLDISIAGGGGGGAISIGATAPISPSNGDLWFNIDIARTFVYYDEVALGVGSTQYWVDSSPFEADGMFLSKLGDNMLAGLGVTIGSASEPGLYFNSYTNTGFFSPVANQFAMAANGVGIATFSDGGLTVGIITANQFYGGGANLTGVNIAGIDTAGTSTFNNISVGGTLTYNDVTNIDSVGLITARNGVIVNTNGISVSAGVVTAPSLVLSGTDGINVGTGASIHQPSSNNITLGTNNEERLRIDSSGAWGIAGANYGTSGQALLSGGSGAAVAWGAVAGGGMGRFNPNITGATGYQLTNSSATAYSAPAAAGHTYVVHSIQVTNISASSADVSADIYSSAYSLGKTIPIPAGSSVELLKQPKVLAASEVIAMQASANSSLHATFTIQKNTNDTSYKGGGADLTSAATYTDLYVASADSVIQSVLLANDDGTADVKARVVWTDGSNSIQGYYVYDMIIPADGTVEVLDEPKFLANGYKIRVYANQADRLEAVYSAKTL